MPGDGVAAASLPDSFGVEGTECDAIYYDMKRICVVLRKALAFIRKELAGLEGESV